MYSWVNGGVLVKVLMHSIFVVKMSLRRQKNKLNCLCGEQYVPAGTGMVEMYEVPAGTIG
jgi:hypothetical protein